MVLHELSIELHVTIYLFLAQKRQACYNEIQSLRSRSSEGECIPDGSGTLSISDIKLPLKQGFIASRLKGEMSKFPILLFFGCLKVNFIS